MCKKSVKPFAAGMIFPAIFLPLAYTAIFFCNSKIASSNYIQFAPMYIPILFGLANIIGLKLGENKNIHLWLVGGCLGVIVSIPGVFVLHIPEVIFNLKGNFVYLPLVLVPIIYGVIFRYIVKWFNNIIL